MSSAFEPLLIAKSTHELGLRPKLANRHGLIAGATGTGKTVTLQRMAEAQTARARRAKPGDGPGTERDARAWQPAGA